MVLSHCRRWNSLSFPGRLCTLEMSERDCSTLANIVLFEGIVAMSACLDSGVVKIELRCSHLNACRLVTERSWSIPLTEVVIYFT